MKSCPAVSIVVPAYNAGRWIGATLESALGQTLNDHEILVVDDGSSDNTRELVEEFCQRDSRIQLIRIANAGVGAARNVGIAAARGEFIAPLDADDLWHPQKLEKQVCCLREGGERTAFAYCWSRNIDEDGNEIMDSFPYDVEGNVLKPLILRNFIGNSSVPLFRASALRRTGVYRTRAEQAGGQGCEDWDLAIRLAENWKVAVVPEILVGYRQTRGCMTSCISCMTDSFEFMLKSARQRNHDIPDSLFRWSAGYFFTYLAAKSYIDSNYLSCLLSVARATWHDPSMLLNRHLLRLAAKSLVLLATGLKREPRPPIRYDRRTAALMDKPLIQRIQDRRWREAIKTTRLSGFPAAQTCPSFH